MQKLLSSTEETINIGKEIAQTISPGDILSLHGNLGTGKTTLVKGIASGLGIKEEITSPSFTLMNVYKANKTNLVHVDTYRLENEQQLIDIGIEDYLNDKNSIVIIEWPEKLKTLLRNKKVVDINLLHEEKGRNISTTLLN